MKQKKDFCCIECFDTFDECDKILHKECFSLDTDNLRDWWMMDDFIVLVGVISSGLIAVNLYVIKSISNLCDRISHLEGKLSRKWERPLLDQLDILLTHHDFLWVNSAH